MTNSRYRSKEFLELRRTWYARLKNEGFEDIEDTESREEFLKQWHSSSFQLTHEPESFAAQEEYYRLATKFLWEYKFTSTVEKEIWRLHADGKSLREISAELHTLGHRMFKDKIHAVVKHLKAIMLGKAEPKEKQSTSQLSLLALFAKVGEDE